MIHGHNTPSTSPEAEAAEHIGGPHLAELLGGDEMDRVRDLLGDDIGDIAVTWCVQTLRHGRPFHEIDIDTGRYTDAITYNPVIGELQAIPVEIVRELLSDREIEPPTRGEVREWSRADYEAGGGGVDPRDAMLRAVYAVDLDLVTAAGPAEPRVCGVPQSIFDTLEPYEQDRVMRGAVIPGPKAPLAVARWLIRHWFSTPKLLTGKNNRRRRIRMRTLVRIDQSWYQYAQTAAGHPGRWVMRHDDEWMGGVLRDILGRLYYVHTRRENLQNVYELKTWNPVEKTVREVESALYGLLSAGTGTHARELPDIYGRMHHFYPDIGAWTQVRNGVLDVSTGKLKESSPLWFSLTQINASYDARSDPYADSLWLRALRDQWADDPGAITCLQQWFGYVLSGRTDLQRWMLILGPKGSGKSLIAGVLSALVGNVSALGLDELNTHFGMQHTYECGASLAVMSDMRFKGRDSSLAVSRLLAITSGCDLVDVPRKFKTSVPTLLPVRFHGSANEMPRLSDHTGALLSRMLVLKTTRVFRQTADDDQGLPGGIIATELGSVLRWAVEGLALLSASNDVFTLSNRAAELSEEIADDMSNVRQFVKECCEFGGRGEEAYTEVRVLFRVWSMWAAENKTGERMSQNAFYKALGSLGDSGDFPIRTGQVRTDDGKRPKVVHGIARVATRDPFDMNRLASA